MIGNSTANVKTIVTSTRERSSGAINCTGEARRIQANDSPIMPDFEAAGLMSAISRLARRGTAEQAARHKHQDDDEDQEDHDIGPARLEEMTAQALNEPDQQTADHCPGDAADAAKH